MRKRFVVHGKRFDVHPRAVVEEVPRWLKQPDANSCGYHLIHNSHPYIQIPNYEGSPEAVFEAVNNLRRRNSQELIARDRNLPSPDLARYFRDKGFDVTQLSNPHFDTDTIDAELARGDFKLIYLSSNVHYTGIVQDQGLLLLLDSLTGGPSAINED